MKESRGQSRQAPWRNGHSDALYGRAIVLEQWHDFIEAMEVEVWFGDRGH